jgi:hypothetical protein
MRRRGNIAPSRRSASRPFARTNGYRPDPLIEGSSVSDAQRLECFHFPVSTPRLYENDVGDVVWCSVRKNRSVEVRGRAAPIMSTTNRIPYPYSHNVRSHGANKPLPSRRETFIEPRGSSMVLLGYLDCMNRDRHRGPPSRPLTLSCNRDVSMRGEYYEP